MEGQIPTQSISEDSSTISPSDRPEGKNLNDGKKDFLFKIILVVIFFSILLVALNYFGVLPLSKTFPNQLGFLPRRETPTATPVQSPPVSATDQAKQALINFLPTVASPSLLPVSNSDIKLDSNNEGFYGSWTTKEGTAGVNFDISSASKEITSLELRYQKIEPTSPSEELAQSETTGLYKLEPKGTWVCTQISTRRSYCENFWEEQDAKRGLGFQMDSLSDESARFIFSFCQYNKDSNYYSWKSCRSEFAKTGVTP